jgi:DNA-binding PadR family transcriptional regulator
MNKSSRLLINENPLIILPSLAVKIGLNEAIILQQIQYWLSTSQNVIDGKKWIYNTINQWVEQFPFLSRSTVQRTLRNLEKKGLIESKQIKKENWDRTKWYTINYDNVNLLIGSSVHHRSGQIDTIDKSNEASSLYTETTTENTTETTTNIKKINKKKIEKKSENKTNHEYELSNWLQEYNTAYNTSFKAIKPLLANFIYWRESYTLDELKTAIYGARRDPYWGKIMNPTLFFRKLDKSKESIDRIGLWLQNQQKAEQRRIDPLEEAIRYFELNHPDRVNKIT